MHLLLMMLKVPRSVGSLVASGFRSPVTQGVTGLAVLLIVIGSVFYWRVEGWSYIDALYFSVVTLTTVGYGDFTPSTTAGKIFTIFYIVIGLGIIAAFLSAFATSSIDVLRKRPDRKLTRFVTAGGRVRFRRRVQSPSADMTADEAHVTDVHGH